MWFKQGEAIVQDMLMRLEKEYQEEAMNEVVTYYEV